MQMGVIGLIGITSAGTLHAQKAEENNPNPPTGPRQKVFPQPNIIDKLLAAEYALGKSLKRNNEEAWATQYKELYGKYHQSIALNALQEKGRPALAMSLGIKATDGVLALKGRDIGALNDCAEQIEKLAQKLGVPSNLLQKASLVKHHADQKRWLEAFMELGYLQHKIMKHLEENPEQKDDALLIVFGAWMQGGRCVTALVLDHYSADASNILREPRLVDYMIEEAKSLSKRYPEDPLVKDLIALLPVVQKRVNVGLNDPIAKAEVQALHSDFDLLVRKVGSAEAPRK